MENKQLTQALRKISADAASPDAVKYNALLALADEQAALQKKQDIVQKFNNAADTAGRVLQKHREILYTDFRKPETNATGFIGAGAELGMGGLGLQSALAQNDPISGAMIFAFAGACAGVAWGVGKTVHGLQPVFLRKYYLLEAQIRTLPDGPEKDLYTQFNKEAKISFALEYATSLHLAKGPGNRKGRKILEGALKDLNVTPAQAQILRDRYKSKDFYAPGEFFKALEQRYEELKTATNSLIVRTLEKPAPGTALPPAPDIP